MGQFIKGKGIGGKECLLRITAHPRRIKLRDVTDDILHSEGLPGCLAGRVIIRRILTHFCRKPAGQWVHDDELLWLIEFHVIRT